MSVTASWAQPSTRPETIENLVSGVDRYNPSNVSILEDYLYHQIRSRECDCMANLAILKLYQFNPALYNPDVVVNVLIKALTAVPLPDFDLCISLLGERPLNPSLDEPDPLPSLLPLITTLYGLLQQCKFPAFWSTFKSEELEILRDNYTVECVGFEDSIREVVVHAVKATFKRISTERLSTYLDLSGEDLQAYVEIQGWAVDSDTGVITIPPNPDNNVEATVVRESIEMPQLSKLIARSVQAI